MNYRHHFHAGNFADVVKHVVLLELVRALQRKPRGFLYLDTHAGRGSYDLAQAAQGDSLTRSPEWPDGIGRLWSSPPAARPAAVQRYLDVVEAFAAPRRTNEVKQPYPGSPRLVLPLLRPEDRMVAYERHPTEAEQLSRELSGARRVRVEVADGYGALRAHLPPPERRALVLIDPPFEAADEFAQVTAALQEGLARMPATTVVVWYPLTERARSDAFLGGLKELQLPPTWTLELNVVRPEHPSKLKGCGLLVVNPPWQLDHELVPAADWLASMLAQDDGAQARLHWIVPE